MGHTFSRVLLHVVFSTKDRVNSLYKNMRAKLLAYLNGVARNEGITIIKANAVDDHVHMLIEIKPAQSPSEVVRKLKANSSKWIHETYPNLKGFAWQSGYSVFSVSLSALPGVVKYIENQEEHHKRLPFAEELKCFFERHQIRFDPEHYLD
jgi:putative transposase